MKAYQVMMFFLLFNLTLSLLSVIPVEDSDGVTHYGLFRIDVEIEETYNVSDNAAMEGAEEDSIPVWTFLGAPLIGIVGGAIAGTIVAYLTKVPADSAIAYSTFTGTFWGITYGGMSVLWNIALIAGGGTPTAIIRIFVFIFIGIMAVIFAAGLLQLIRGGWSSYK